MTEVHAYLAAEAEEPLLHAVLLGDDPDGVDDAGEVAEEGEQQADPELDLQKHVQHQQLVNPTLDGITLRREPTVKFKHVASTGPGQSSGNSPHRRT